MREVRKKHTIICMALERHMTKEFLQKYYLPLVKSILPQCDNTLRKLGLGEFIPKDLSELSSKNKREMADAVALLFVDIQPYRYFRQALDKETLVLWDALVFNEKIGFDQADLEYHLSVEYPKANTYRNYREPDVRPQFQLFPRKSEIWSYLGRAEHFYLPQALREFIVRFYEVPDWAKLTPIKALPDKAMVYSDAESRFFSDYSRLKIYFEQGEINYSAKLRPMANGLAKVQKMVQIGEFFPDADIKRHKVLRTNILSTVIPYLVVIESKYPELHNALREFFSTVYSVGFATAPALLPDIKGLGNIDNDDFSPFEGKLFHLLKALPANSFVSVDNLLGYCKYNLIEAAAINRGLAAQKLGIDGAGNFSYSPGINFKDYKKAIQLPLIRGSFFLFAALGLCELVYDKLDSKDFGFTKFSPWDGLIAVKRTPLGDYVCGLTDQYQLAAPTNSGFTLSDKALLIKLESAESPFVSSLGIFAEQISPLSFKTDAGTFLKNINRKEELTAKIELFKQMALGDIPKNWEDFFNSLYGKINPLTLYDNCAIFSVPKENQELIRLLAQDPIIKTLISKAEGYLIIVHKKNYSALRRRLAEFGYLQT